MSEIINVVVPDHVNRFLTGLQRGPADDIARGVLSMLLLINVHSLFGGALTLLYQKRIKGSSTRTRALTEVFEDVSRLKIPNLSLHNKAVGRGGRVSDKAAKRPRAKVIELIAVSVVAMLVLAAEICVLVLSLRRTRRLGFRSGDLKGLELHGTDGVRAGNFSTDTPKLVKYDHQNGGFSQSFTQSIAMVVSASVFSKPGAELYRGWLVSYTTMTGLSVFVLGDKVISQTRLSARVVSSDGTGYIQAANYNKKPIGESRTLTEISEELGGQIRAQGAVCKSTSQSLQDGAQILTLCDNKDGSLNGTIITVLERFYFMMANMRLVDTEQEELVTIRDRVKIPAHAAIGSPGKIEIAVLEFYLLLILSLGTLIARVAIKYFLAFDVSNAELIAIHSFERHGRCCGDNPLWADGVSVLPTKSVLGHIGHIGYNIVGVEVEEFSGQAIEYMQCTGNKLRGN